MDKWEELNIPDDQDRYNKARYFMDRVVPKTQFLLQRMRKGSNTMMNANL